MSYNSLTFLYLFLPLSCILVLGMQKIWQRSAKTFFIGLSVLFLYIGGGWSSLIVLLASILVNYAMGSDIARKTRDNIDTTPAVRRGVILNVLLLVFFKYAQTLTPVLPQFYDSFLQSVGFPLAISFYTFSQIAFLVELSRGKLEMPTFTDYLLYIVYFPKLIAGPIMRPSEFFSAAKETFGRWNADRMLQGLTLFFIGLAKKAFVADQIQPFASYVFEQAEADKAISFVHAWIGILSYGFQLYFDFSGYSDMAIGVSLLFGIALPLNFDAPYRAQNITEFWRRWHMTLSAFFRDYVYIGLGGNRKGTARKYLNLFITMSLCGLWHGSGILFLLWGSIHGVYLIIHNIWMAYRKNSDPNAPVAKPSKLALIPAHFLTFMAVMVAWIPFRAQTVSGMIQLLTQAISIPSVLPTNTEYILAGLTVVLPLLAVILLPTSQKWLSYSPSVPEKSAVPASAIAAAPATSNPFSTPAPVTPSVNTASSQLLLGWRINLLYGFITGCIALAGIISISEGTQFIYRNF